MVIAEPIGAVTTELAHNTYVTLHDSGFGHVFDLAGNTIPLSTEALDRLLVTLLARQAERNRNDERTAAGVE